jgi:PAS domain S-box-containing protein
MPPIAGDGIAVWLTIAAAVALVAAAAVLWCLRRASRQLAGSNVLLQQEAERRGAIEQALHDAQTRVGTILEAVPEGVIAFDDRGLIESCNPAAQAIFGCDAARLIDRPVDDLLPEMSRLRSAPSEGAAPAAVQRHRIDAHRLDGTAFPLEITCRALGDGARRLHIWVLRDLGEQHRIERMKRDFVSVVSHELRTPLTSIRGALALLGDGSTGVLPADAQRMVLMASRNCERLVELVNDILDLDKMQTGQMVVAPEVQDVVKLLRDTLRTTLGFARLYKVRLLMPGHAGPVWVSVDARRMAQVMGNLLSNAIKFSPEGGEVLVRLRARPTHCTIFVVDHGPGIPVEFRARVFEPVAQANATDSRARGGSGLGLSITRSLVKRMGGSIDFDCPERGGSVFRVTLPIAESPPRPTEFAPTGLGDLHV